MPTDADVRAGFMKAIREEPSEDFHRLVFADWLEENGDERDAAQAEFIRVQCKLAGQPSRCDCMCEYECGIGCASVIHGELRKRERALFSFNNLARWGGHEWERNCLDQDDFRTVPGGVMATLWRRGFVTEVRCPFVDWVNRDKKVVLTQPVEVVRPTDKRPFRPTDQSRWYWLEEIPSLPHSIGEYWNSLGNTEWEGGCPQRNRGYASEQEAYDDLSETLIRLAKKAGNEP